MRKISVWFAGALVLTAIVATFFTTLWLERRNKAAPQDKLLEAADLIQTSFIGEADREEMTDAAVSAMVESLGDQWSYYLSTEELAEYRSFEHNQYQGLGLVVKAGEEGGVVIHAVYRKSPAGEAGVLPGSRIVSVNGADTRDAALSDAVLLVKEATAAGEVTLGLQTPSGEEQTFTLVPGDVDTDPVTWELLPEGIGLITVSNFEDRCGEQTLDALQELLDLGAKGFIFDVRDNPGGQLTQLLTILDRILPEGPLFISKDTQGRTDTEYSDGECLEMPVAVLVNAGTYSAAEFFAAALREYDWAAVIGEQTTGKGYAQVTLMLSDGSAIHLSTIEYFTPLGNSLAGVGLTPDLEVEMDLEKRQDLAYGLLPHEEDPQLEAAIGTLMAEINP